MDANFIDQLAKKLQQPLPGETAQFKMAHVARRSRVAPPEHAREAGVLALFYPRGSEWYIVLIERVSSNRHDRHGGQISFPGGKRETQDPTLKDTALREAEEEVGVSSQKIELLGELTELYIPVSNFKVHPHVGFVADTPKFAPEVKEVRTILEVPFEHFLNAANRKQIDLKIAKNLTLRNVPYFDVLGKIVWGATAMMMSELLEILEKD
jgi:8-oxo-dGTP pyrophosphatase MutT (NUDIX family)